MSWYSPFVIYRINSEGELIEVYRADDIKKARYLLSYIAKPGDILCRTPAHPKHSQETQFPEYCSHKEEHNQTSSNIAEWQCYANQMNWCARFPTEQSENPAGAEGH